MRFNSAYKLRNLILLFVLALFAPVIAGFQYLEWHDTNHLFIGIMGPIWAISYSDMYLNEWLIILFPNILVLTPRLLFVFALARHNRERPSLTPLGVFGVLLTAIDVYICLTMMTVNSIFGIPPGPLYLFPRPDIDVRQFVPVPILLLVGIYLIWKNRSSEY